MLRKGKFIQIEIRSGGSWSCGRCLELEVGGVRTNCKWDILGVMERL